MKLQRGLRATLQRREGQAHLLTAIQRHNWASTLQQNVLAFTESLEEVSACHSCKTNTGQDTFLCFLLSVFSLVLTLFFNSYGFKGDLGVR